MKHPRRRAAAKSTSRTSAARTSNARTAASASTTSSKRTASNGRGGNGQSRTRSRARQSGRATARVASRSEAPKTRYPQPPFPEQHQRQPGLEHRLSPSPRWRGESYKPAGKLEGRVALITGGDSGIGRSIAYFFAREGADIAIICLPQEREDAELVQKAIEELGRECLVMYGDLARLDVCEKCIEHTVSEFGGLDILVHNAAAQTRSGDVTEITEESLDRTMKTNIYAYIRLVRAAAPHLKPGSSIIATGSVVGLEGSERLLEYSATKGAIHTLTKSLAEELLDKGIRVNCVAPGPVWTPLNVADPGMSRKEVSEFGMDESQSPMERPAQPEELAPAYVFLASNADSSYITGAVIPVTGGRGG